jgi:hypothetical protein
MPTDFLKFAKQMADYDCGYYENASPQANVSGHTPVHPARILKRWCRSREFMPCTACHSRLACNVRWASTINAPEHQAPLVHGKSELKKPTLPLQ